MKKLFSLLVLTVFVITANAQSDTIKPQFPGGPAEMKKFIAENMRWPAMSDEVEGTVYMRFTVEKDGTITHIEVAKGIPTHAGFDQEATRLVSVMPEWIPGKIKEQPVAMEVTIPIRFVVN